MHNEDRPNHKAIVNMFKDRLLCWVTAYGEKLKEYKREQILCVECGEDLLLQPNYKEPYCILYRRDWMSGKNPPNI